MKNMMKVSLLVMAILFTTSTVSATLISTDWINPGDNNITHDTATGTEWLDIDVTLGLSVNEVTAKMQAGGELEGFRFATLPEFNALNETLGITWTPACSWSHGIQFGIALMHGLFDGVSTKNYTWYTIYNVTGYTVDASTGNLQEYEYIWRFNRGNPPRYMFCSTVDHFGHNEYLNLSNPNKGHFLVKGQYSPSTVPEPATLVLLSIGMVGLVSFINKRK